MAQIVVDSDISGCGKRPALTVSVVVLNFRTPEGTARALECVRDAASGLTIEEIVVDNASRDGSVEAIRRLRPEARVIEMTENLGFAAGMNAGVREAHGDYLLLLNSDVEAAPASIRILVEYMQANPGVGLAAPLLVDSGGRPSRTLLVQPTLWRVLIPLLGKVRYKQWKRRIGTEPLEVEVTEGAALMVARETIECAGMLDEDFFFYHEIVEWCLRIRDCGRSVVVVPGARMVHVGGGSTGKLRLAARVELKRSEYQLLRKRLGRLVCALSIARDAVSEALRCLEYGLGVLLSTGRWGQARTKLSIHWVVLAWTVMGMPDRRDPRYTSTFGAWD